MSDGTPGENQQDPAPTAVELREDGILTYEDRTFVDKGRFDGAIRKIDELTQEQKRFEAQLQERLSEVERLNTELATRDAEKSAIVGERDKKLEEMVQGKLELEKELAELRNLRMKTEVIKEVGDPSLMMIIDTIPNMTDKDALKAIVGDLAEWRANSVKEREAELLAGTTEPPPAPTTTATPNSSDGWAAHIESFPIGSPERKKAQDQQFEWLMKQTE